MPKLNLLKNVKSPQVGLVLRCIRPSVFLYVALLVAFKSSAFEYQVTGIVRWRAYNSTQVVKDESSDFDISVLGCTWAMGFKHKGDEVYDYQKVYFDGTNVYWMGSIEQSVKRHSMNGEHMGDNLAVGSTFKSEVPHFHQHLAGPIWLAYASGCYFQSHTNSFAEPPSFFSTFSGRSYGPGLYIEERVDKVISNNEPLLPIRIAYFDDGVLRSVFGENTVVTNKSVDKGRWGEFTNAVFAVSEFHSIGNLSLPATSAFSIFSADYRKLDTNALRLTYSYLIEAKRFEAAVEPISWPPQLPLFTCISDFRFLSNNNGGTILTYFKGEKFATEEEARDNPTYKQAQTDPIKNAKNIEFMRKTPISIRTNRKFYLAPIVLLLSGTLLYLIIHNNKKHRQLTKG